MLEYPLENVMQDYTVGFRFVNRRKFGLICDMLKLRVYKIAYTQRERINQLTRSHHLPEATAIIVTVCLL